jgi:muramoyltetrapeptide carboxypeptidase
MSAAQPPLQLPPPLQSGDRVALVAASSALDGPGAAEQLEAGLTVLESWGLEVERRELEQRRWGYLAGSDPERRADLERGARSGAALLACLRGGWGAARLLEGPLPLPRRWLLGFSDVTSLLWAQLAAGQGGAIHGPLLTTLAAEPAWSRQRLHDLLFGLPLPPLQGQGCRSGKAEGPLLVANLTVATHLLGTRHLPSLAGAILVLEDVGEAPYRLERMLTHWRLSGALHQLAGIGFGRFSDCDEPPGESSDGSGFTARQVLLERTADLGIPVLENLPVGHEPGNAALPLGVPARLDGDRGTLELLP